MKHLLREEVYSALSVSRARSQAGVQFKNLRKMVIVKDDQRNVDTMCLRRTKTKHLNNFHAKKTEISETESRDSGEGSSRDQDKDRCLIDHLCKLDITLSRKLSFCADKDSGPWRTVMIILEITGHGVPWIAGTIISILVLSDLKQEFACNLFLALMFDLAVVGGLKIAVRRKRPIYNEKDMFATVSVDNYSFPSGHSTRVAMLAALFAVFLTNVLWKFVIGCWALFVSISRVVLGRHHVSDVFCGVMIGLLQCWVVCTLWVSNKKFQQLLMFLPL